MHSRKLGMEAEYYSHLILRWELHINILKQV